VLQSTAFHFMIFGSVFQRNFILFMVDSKKLPNVRTTQHRIIHSSLQGSTVFF
jgi:hypothetical protein